VDISSGADWPDSSSAEKDLGVLQDNKLMSVSQQCTPMAKGNSCLGCWHIKEVILPFCSVVLRPHLEPGVQCWVSQCEKVVDLIKQVQQRATKQV